jgi:hypothetical protein
MPREPLSREDYDEYQMDFAEGFAQNLISETQYRQALAEVLGMNATDIEEEVRRNRPPM